MGMQTPVLAPKKHLEMSREPQLSSFGQLLFSLVPVAAPTGADFPSFGPVFLQRWEIRATAGTWRLLWVP